MDNKDKKIRELETENKSLRKKLVKLEEKIKELEGRLGLNSENSSKPSSTNGFTKPENKRSPTPGKLGGQKGHKGKTLKHDKNPDHVVTLSPEHCTKCNANLADIETTKIEKRQEIDIEIKRKVTEYQAEVKKCLCGCVNKGSFPDHIKSYIQYGSSLRFFAVTLSQNFVAKDRITQVLKELVGITLTDTTLIKIENDLAQKLETDYQTIKQTLVDSDLKNLDETGFRVKKSLFWLHVLCNSSWTFYHIHEKRGHLIEDLKGAKVHDHWKPYFKLEGRHILCKAHLIREVEFFVQEGEEWAKSMKYWLRYAQISRDKSDAIKYELLRIYDSIVSRGLEYYEKLKKLSGRKKRKGHNLLIRFRDFKKEITSFLDHPDEPFTNNQAEQDLRMMKVKQKVSGCFRTEEGVQTFVKVRSVLSTLRKQGEDVWAILRKLMLGEVVSIF